MWCLVWKWSSDQETLLTCATHSVKSGNLLKHLKLHGYQEPFTTTVHQPRKHESPVSPQERKGSYDLHGHLGAPIIGVPMAAPWRALGPEGSAEPRVDDFLILRCRNISPGERRSCLHPGSTEQTGKTVSAPCPILWCSLRSRSCVSRRPRPSWVQSESKSQQLLIVGDCFLFGAGTQGLTCARQTLHH